MRRFSIGEENFLRNWSAFQEIDDGEPVKRISAIAKPVNRMRVRIERIVENWLLFVGLTLLCFSMKILAELLLGYLR